MSLRQDRLIRRIQSSAGIPFKYGTRTDQIAIPDWPHGIGRDQYMPMAQQMTSNAIEVDRKYSWLYQKKVIGRRCTCYIHAESPSGDCPICFKTGFVGGYDKWGTKAEYFDMSATMSLVGCAIEFKNRPQTIEIAEGKKEALIYVEVEMMQNPGILDMWQFAVSNPPGTEVHAFVMAPSDVDWVEANDNSLAVRLQNKSLKFKIQMLRADADVATPKFSHFMFRYNLREDARIVGDWPPIAETISLGDYGIYDAWQTVQVNFDSTVQKIGSEDFFHNIRVNRRWKVVENTDKEGMGVLLGHETTLRLVQVFEPYEKIP